MTNKVINIEKVKMKSIVLTLAALFAVSAFAADAAKPVEVVKTAAAPAPAASAPVVKTEAKHKKATAATPAKAASAPVVEVKAAEPAKK